MMTSEMKVAVTEYASIYLSKKEVGNQIYGFYVLHNVEVVNEVLISKGDKSVSFYVAYQTACSYDHNDYSCPSPLLAVYADLTCEVLNIINDIEEHEFKGHAIAETLHEVNELCEFIESVDDMYKVWNALRISIPDVANYIE